MVSGKSSPRHTKATGTTHPRRRKFDHYSVFIYRVLKQIHPDLGISKKGMQVVNAFIVDLFEKIALEASKLIRYQRKTTISSGDIQSAVKLVLPGELAEHAIAEGIRALQKFAGTKPSETD